MLKELSIYKSLRLFIAIQQSFDTSTEVSLRSNTKVDSQEARTVHVRN